MIPTTNASGWPLFHYAITMGRSEVRGSFYAPTDHAAALDASDDESTADRAAVARVDAATWTAVREWGEQYDLRLDLVDARMSSADAPSALIVCVRQAALACPRDTPGWTPAAACACGAGVGAGRIASDVVTLASARARC